MPTNWRKLKARARRRHGLSPTEFARLLPCEWLALELDLAEEERSAWLRTAQLCATLANCHRDRKQRAYRASDFMPRRRRRGRQSIEEQMAILERAARLTQPGKN